MRVVHSSCCSKQERNAGLGGSRCSHAADDRAGFVHQHVHQHVDSVRLYNGAWKHVPCKRLMKCVDVLVLEGVLVCLVQPREMCTVQYCMQMLTGSLSFCCFS